MIAVAATHGEKPIAYAKSNHDLCGMLNHLSASCPAIVGTKPFTDENKVRHFVGTGISFDKNGYAYVANDNMGVIDEIQTV